MRTKFMDENIIYSENKVRGREYYLQREQSSSMKKIHCKNNCLQRERISSMKSLLVTMIVCNENKVCWWEQLSIIRIKFVNENNYPQRKIKFIGKDGVHGQK